MIVAIGENDWGTTIPTATNAGSYTVYYKVVGDSNHNDTEAASVTVTIAKAASSVTTAPTAIELTYTGNAQVLVNAGTPSGGTMYYSLEQNGEYSASIPTAIDAGNYTVYYKVIGDSNHNDTEAANVTVTISKAASSVPSAPTATNPTYNGTAQALVTAGEASGGEMQYSTSENGTYSTTIPTGTDAGDYTVYYKVVGDSNHNDYTAGTPISVIIAKATPTDPATPTPSAVTYSPSQTLSSIALADGWTWADSTIVPTVVNSGYTAYYAVSDYTNYDWSSITGYDAANNRVARTVTLTVNASQLAAPTNLQWSGSTTTVTASWDEVTTASSYTVQLYKDGAAEGSAVSVTTGTSTDFTITDAGSYTFTVTAVGTDNYSSSAESEASAALNFYTITWNYGDSAAKTDVVMSGVTPTAPTDTAKTSDGTYIYTFNGWSPTVSAITADTTYTAQYSLTYVAPATGAGYAIDYSAETATAASGYEISTDGSTWSSTLTVTPSGTLYVRRAADTAASASAETTNTLASRGNAPEVTAVNEVWYNESDGQITNVTTEMEYRLSGGTWADCSGTTVTGLAAGSYEVRYKATTSAFASTATTVTIASGTARTYTLTVTAPTFAAVTYGYTQPEAASITITSTGNSAATITGVTVGSTNFTISGSGSTVTAGGTIETWTIQPAANLAAGTYNDTITVTYNGTTVTADVSFTVNKATPSVTAPEAQTLTYNGSAQELVSAGSTTGGTMYYSLSGNDEDWSTSVPTGTSAGEYIVYYKVVGDSNYTDLTPASNSVSVTIAKATLTPSISGNTTKTYDGTATASGLTIALTGAVNGEEPSATASFAYDSADAGDKTITASGITLSGSAAGNYTLANDTATTDGTITAASLTGDMFTVDTDSVTYTGSEITKTINSSLALDTDYTVAYADNTNVGTATITITGTGNYTGTLTYSFAITAAAQTGVTASGYSGSYDGAAHGITVTAEGVTVTYSETENGTYAADNPTYTNAGTYTVYYKVTRANYADYTGSATVEISKVTLTPSISGTTSKTYDGTADASGLTITLDGAVGTENPTATASSYTYNSANVSEATSITAAGVVLDDDWGTNYELDATTASTSGTISAKSVTASISGTAEKTYDGTTTASGLSIMLTGTVGNDDVTAEATSYAYDSADAGSRTVTASSITLSGSAAGNYTLVSDTATASGTINKKEVTATVTAADKVYDSTNTATVSAMVSDGIIDSDSISISGLTGAFANADVGTGKTVTVETESTSISGTNCANYTITYNTTGVTASITQATPATVIFPTASDITYGATLASSELTGGSGDGTFAWTNPDTVPTVTNSGYSVTFTPSDATNYDYSNVTLTQTVYITVEKALSNVDTAPIANALTYTGSAQALVEAGTATGGTMYYSLEQNGNYTTTIPAGTTAGTYTVYYKAVGDDNHEDTAAASVNAEIGKVTLTPTISGATTKIYDGTTDASGLTIELSGAVGSESPTATAASYSYDSANVSEATTITAAGIALGTEWQTNYRLSADTVTTDGSITAATQTGVTATGYSGSYDGSAHSITVTAEGATVTYSTTDSDYTADNPTYTDAGTYTVYYKVTRANYADYTGSETVVINKVTLTPSISGTTSKTYDGTADASGLTITLTDAVNGEEPNATAAFAYDSADAGDRTITASNIALDGTWETNYALSDTTASTSGTISAKSVTASISGTAERTYDGTTSVSELSITLTGTVGNDDVTAEATSYAYDSASAGSKTVTASGITLSGSAAGNYTLESDTATASGTITEASLTGDMFSVDTGSMTYTGSAITKTIDSSLTLDTDYTVAYADNTNVGTATIIISGIGNYSDELTYSFTINKADPTYTLPTGLTAIYGDTLANVALTDGWTWDSSTASVGSVGTKSFSATFMPSDTDNYNNVTEILSVTVAPLPVTVTWSGTSFTYDGTEKTVTAAVANAVGGDTVTLTYEGNTGTAVGSYTARVTAVSDDNYTIVGAAGLEQEWSIMAGAGITVTFDANGRSATNMPAQQTGLYYGDKLTEPEDPIADDSDYGFVGWYTDADCTDAWDFESDTVGTEDITLYAKWEQVYFAVEVTVLDSSGNAYAGDATITLMRGSEVIDTKSITNGTGQFSEHVEAGMYNVVVSYTDDNDTHTKTALITVDDDATVTVTLPPAGVNSTLTVSDSSETPAVMVGGLDEEAAAVMAELQASGSLAEDVYKVTVTMIVEGSQEADVDSAAADAIKNIAEEVAVGTEGSSTVVDYLDVSVMRQVNDNSGEAVSETNTVLEVVVPFVFDGRDNIVVVRHHEGDTEQLQKLAAMPSSYADGTFYLNESTGYIHIYAQKFSVYAVAYTTTETYDITFDDCNGTTVVATTSTDGKLAELPAPADRGGYTFNGWYTAAEGGTQVTTSYVFTKDTTVYAHWTAQATTTGGSGGGSHSYGTSVESADNGSVTVSPANAASGTTVTLTVTPDEGYELASLTVTSGDEEIAVTKVSDTEYTFTMPSSRVTVEATFTEVSGTHDDCSSEHFTDVDTEAWYHEYIDYVVESGLMNGTSATTFEPDVATTRGMIVTILHRLEDEPTASVAHGFDDVVSESYYADSIAWAAENGIVAGYGDGSFGPDDAITREQMAAILYRYAQYKGYDVSVGENTNILSFDDATEASEYAIPALQWAVGSGLIEGTGTATLSPQGNATRAQAAAILTRFIENIMNAG